MKKRRARRARCTANETAGCSSSSSSPSSSSSSSSSSSPRAPARMINGKKERKKGELNGRASNENERERERGSYGERTREGESVVGYRQCLADV